MRELVAEKIVEPAASIEKLVETVKAAQAGLAFLYPDKQDTAPNLDPDNLDENSPELHPLKWMELKYEM
jgi:hypothetical protein